MTQSPGPYGAGDPSATPVPPGWSPVQPPPIAPPAPQPGPQAGGWTSGPGWAPGGPGAPGPAWTPPAPKPGIIPLRPLGVGELLDGAISTLRTHPRPVLGLSALVAVLTQLVEVPLTWLLLGDVGETVDTASLTAVLGAAWPALVVSAVVTLIATTFLTGVLTVVVSRAVLGEEISAGEAWAHARPRLPALVAVTLVSLMLAVGVVVVAVGAALLAIGTGASDPAAVGAGVLAGLGAGVVATWVYIRLALAAPAVVLERRTAAAALGRSWRLVKGSWWRTFGVIALVTVIATALAGILAVPFSVLAELLNGTGGVATGLGPLTVEAVGTVLAAAVTWPFSAAATVLLYVDRRMRREGLDLDLARAAGRADRSR